MNYIGLGLVGLYLAFGVLLVIADTQRHDVGRGRGYAITQGSN